MPAFTTYSRLQQENEGRREWRAGRRDQHRCHSLVKALQYWWAPAAASLSTLARRHQLSDYTHGRYYQQSVGEKQQSYSNCCRRTPGGTNVTTRDHDYDQIVAWCHDHRSLKWSHKHSPIWHSATVPVCDYWLLTSRLSANIETANENNSLTQLTHVKASTSVAVMRQKLH